jgi:hypothetical protein
MFFVSEFAMTWATLSKEIDCVEITSGNSFFAASFLKTRLEFISKINTAEGLYFGKKER